MSKDHIRFQTFEPADTLSALDQTVKVGVLRLTFSHLSHQLGLSHRLSVSLSVCLSVCDIGML